MTYPASLGHFGNAMLAFSLIASGDALEFLAHGSFEMAAR